VFPLNFIWWTLRVFLYSSDCLKSWVPLDSKTIFLISSFSENFYDYYNTLFHCFWLSTENSSLRNWIKFSRLVKNSFVLVGKTKFSPLISFCLK
jgi:hypothetical protein